MSAVNELVVSPVFTSNTLSIPVVNGEIFTASEKIKLAGIQQNANAYTYSLQITDDGAGTVTVQLVQS